LIHDILNKGVGVVGLGYVGLPLVASLASVGFRAVGVDINEAKMRQLRETGVPDFYEFGLQELLSRYRSTVSFTLSHSEMMRECSTIIITVGTQLKEDGTTDLDGLTSCRDAIAPYLSQDHLLILKSTVPCGTTRAFAAQLEEISGLVAGKDFFVAYCPERTIEGHAIHELRYLPKVIGGLNPESAERARLVLGRLGGRVVVVSSPEVAEMCKLVDNAYRATNIAFANEIGLICEGLEIDSYELVSAINDGYERTSLFRSGLGAGGACLSKDPTVLALSAQKCGVDAKIIKTGIDSNQKATLRVARLIADYIREHEIAEPRVALMGLAFKGLPETDDTRGAAAGIIHRHLRGEFPNTSFNYYDPLVRTFDGQNVSSTIKGALEDANVAIFLTNHATLLSVRSAEILEACTGRPFLVIDCWHNIDDAPELVAQGVEVIRIGDGTL